MEDTSDLQASYLSALAGSTAAKPDAPVIVNLNRLCHNLDWSPIGASAAQSAMAALLAGFVFAGIIVVLSVKADNQRESAQALKLLFTAFLGLAVTAYLLADVTGEQTCLRAETTEVLAGGLLGTFAVITIIGLTWLVIAYNRHDNGVLKVIHALVYIASAFVLLLLSTSATSYLSADLPGRSHLAADILLYSADVFAFALGAIWVWRVQRHAPAPDSGNTTQVSATTDQAVNRCVWATLTYLVLAAVGTGVQAALPPSMWNPLPAAWAVYLATVSSIIAPLAVLALALRAHARVFKPEQTDEVAPTPDVPSQAVGEEVAG